MFHTTHARRVMPSSYLSYSISVCEDLQDLQDLPHAWGGVAHTHRPCLGAIDQTQ